MGITEFFCVTCCRKEPSGAPTSVSVDFDARSCFCCDDAVAKSSVVASMGGEFLRMFYMWYLYI